MRQTVAAAIVAALIAGAAWAQDTSAARPAIEDTIRSQIDAFRQDDFAAAFTFASPGIQRLFGTPENFGAMVRNGYPMVWRPDDLRFTGLRQEGGVYWQTVVVTDADGRTHALEYRMEQADGAWRIAGVRFLPAPEMSV